MKQEMHDKSTAGGENTGENSICGFLPGLEGGSICEIWYGPSYCGQVVNPGVLRLFASLYHHHTTHHTTTQTGGTFGSPEQVCPPAPELSCSVRRETQRALD